MPSLTAIGLRTALLSGTYTAGTFETALATASTAAAFTELVNTYGSAEILVNSTVALPVITGASTARTIAGNGPAFLRACANSSYATEQLVTTTNGAALFGIVLLDSTGGKFSHWRDISGNYTRIKSWVNASGSKLKSQSFTSSGTWTKPTTLYAMSIFAVGGGGSGSAYSNGSGSGGGGGEIECVNVAFGSLPGANQTVTIGAGGASVSSPSNGNPGTNTTVGSLITASFGSGGLSASGGTGGGTTANGGYVNFTEWEQPLFAAFQCVNAAQKGGNGGRGRGSASAVGTKGSDGLPGSGGNPAYDTPDTTSEGGKLYGGGGGGFCDNIAANGGSAAANTGGGGGGFGLAAGGAGGSGIAVIYWLEG